MTIKRFHRRDAWVAAVASLLLVLAPGASTLAQDQTADAASRAETPREQLNYRIGAGDQINVDVWRRPELSIVVPVRPDGKISTPLVEDLVAVGKTPTQLAREIEEVLSEFIRTPQVTVIVQGFVGTFSSQVQVLGQVVNPGPVAYRDQMTLLNAVLEAGGLTPFAAGNRSKLTRIVDGEAVEQRVRLKRLLEKGELGENLPLLPGDVIFVPAAAF